MKLVPKWFILLVWQDVPATDFKCANSSEHPINVEESTCSYKFTPSNPTNHYGNAIRCTGKVFMASDVNDDVSVIIHLLQKVS